MTTTNPDHSCGLYLRVQAGGDLSAVSRLIPMLEHTSIASVLIEPAPGMTLDAQDALPLVDEARAREITVMVSSDAQLARTIKSDGVHLSWSDDVQARYTEAREILGQRAIIGADAGRSRDVAMRLGEGEADYIAFGIPKHVGDVEKAMERQLDLVAWWAEIFVIPVVAFDVKDVGHARELARVGADLVALHMPNGLSGEALKDWLNEASMLAQRDSDRVGDAREPHAAG